MKKQKDKAMLQREKEVEQKKKTNAAQVTDLKAKIALEMQRIKGLMATKKTNQKENLPKEVHEKKKIDSTDTNGKGSLKRKASSATQKYMSGTQDIEYIETRQVINKDFSNNDINNIERTRKEASKKKREAAVREGKEAMEQLKRLAAEKERLAKEMRDKRDKRSSMRTASRTTSGTKDIELIVTKGFSNKVLMEASRTKKERG